jgi:putative membrane-bound dehydrogenase-like protein
MFTLVVLPLFALGFVGCRESKPDEQPAYSPQKSLESMKLSEDFKVELFLNEPQVMSPVEMVFDENGRIYVAEMLDYPDDPPPGKPARSRIKLLEDNDGDGGYERVIVFADQVLQVSGILPWKGGLLVTSAPDILWMKDDDGDGKADTRKTLYTGFPKVNPENRITNLRYGIDNWVYSANHGNDGRITSPDRPEHPPVMIRGADFRFHPVNGEFEAASGPAQFGLTFDDWGNLFITQNTIHIRHVVLPMNYIARAPLLDVPAYAQDISDHGRPSAPMFPLTRPQRWRTERTRLRQQRYDEHGLNRTEHVGGYFTAASGGTVYHGDVFPEEYVGNVFTGDVSGNLVHRDILKPDGVTLSAARAKEGVEFLSSTDIWFRPCNFANAPDGNLYLLDIYRLFIETPESIPEEIKKGMDFYAGDTLGRIYRIVPNHPRRQRDLRPKLGSAGAEELVKNLESANGWRRHTAQRLIVERQDQTALPFLKQLCAESQSPVGRIHALWTLQGLSGLNEQIVLRGLKDQHPRVREHAVRLAEEFLPKSKPLADALLVMTDDADLRVRFQLAFTLGQLGDIRALNALARLAMGHSQDQWFRLAILSSVSDDTSQFFHLLRAQNPAFENPELFFQLASLIGAKRDAAELASLLAALSSFKQSATVEAALNGMIKGMKLANVTNLSVARAGASLSPFLKSDNEALQNAAWEAVRFFHLPQLVNQAKADAQATGLSTKQRVTAIRALRGGQYPEVAPLLRNFLNLQDSPGLQAAAVESLAAFDDPQVAPALLGSWPKYTPELRQKVLTALLSDRDRMKTLMQALEDGQVERTAFDPGMQARLHDHPDKDVTDRAGKYFKQAAEERSAAIAGYRDALNLAGDVGRGRDIFSSTCAKCHVPQQGRPRIGPDLSGISNKTREELLNSILNPSAAIEPRFANYIVTTKNGRFFDGLLANETPGAITLRTVEGDTTILRKNLVEIRASKVSLMPDGLEQSLSKQAIADLIAYLRGGL